MRTEQLLRKLGKKLREFRGHGAQSGIHSDQQGATGMAHQPGEPAPKPDRMESDEMPEGGDSTRFPRAKDVPRF